MVEMSGRRLRYVEIDATEPASEPDALQRIFDGQLDVLLVRRALPQAAVTRAATLLDAGDTALPMEDQGGITLVGIPLTPNYWEQEGPELDRYLDVAERLRAALPVL